MICLVSTNTQGGIIQYLFKVAEVLSANGYDVVCFIPLDTVFHTNLAESQIVKFLKVKTFFSGDFRIRRVAKKILSYSPNIVWFVDTAIPTCQISLALKGCVKTLLTVHDGGEIHPTHEVSCKQKLKQLFEHAILSKAIARASYVVVLSKYVEKKICSTYPQSRFKIVYYPLGAHIPNVNPLKPQELGDGICEKFFLFFGRIDKYKGVGVLLDAYSSWLPKPIELVIAGNGILTEKENILAQADQHIHLIRRFISDEEMVWLFRNCNAVVLPYIEATQSGVIPIAYSFGKPVIVSDVEGLTQFVKAGVTGFICHDSSEYHDAFTQLSGDIINYSNNCCKYYSSTMDWNIFIKDFIRRVSESR